MPRVINPATGECVREYETMSLEHARQLARGARQAQRDWARRAVGERVTLLRAVAEGLQAQRDAHARLMAREMGKPIAQGRAEIDKCASVCRYYAEQAPGMLEPLGIATDARRSYVAHAPLGVVLAIMPWNFPFWQLFRFAAPALAAGNAVLLKHASNVPGCAQAIETLLREAGAPQGLVTSCQIDDDAAQALIAAPEVAAVTLTGSTRAGRAVAATAGTALKKCVLELGGSDAYVVLADADLERAAEICVEARMVNGGQSCIAGKRFVVEQPVLDELRERVCEHMKRFAMGDPLDEQTRLGPMARQDLRDTVHRQVAESRGAGARVLLGGEIQKRAGAWYPATVLDGVGPGMPAYGREVFGPVAAIIAARDAAHAIEIANDSEYGLGAAVFTRDVERGERIAREQLHAGCCFVNAQVRSDPRLPFGGIKDSGYGRELGPLGIHEFVNAKTVYVA